MHKPKRQLLDRFRMDEIYVRVGGMDIYLFGAADKYGNTIDFLLTKRSQKMSTQKFFNKSSQNTLKRIKLGLAFNRRRYLLLLKQFRALELRLL